MTRKCVTLFELAKLVDGEAIGDSSYEVNCIEPIESASEYALSFLVRKKQCDFETVRAGIVFLHEDDAPLYSGNKIVCEDPYLAFAKASALFETRTQQLGIHPTAIIDPSAIIAHSASIGANCVIGANVILGEHSAIHSGCVIGEGASLGAHVLIHANVTIYHFVRVGERVTIHGGAVIGADGFGFAPSREGWQKIHQLGTVQIGDDVEIGANTTIDRGALSDTIIGSDVIIDNLVHIAHNVEVGDGTAIAGCSAIAGSTKIGKRCIIAGRVSIVGHLRIADGTQFNACTLVTHSIDKSGAYASAPLMQDVKIWRKNAIRFNQLDYWIKKIKALEKTLRH